MAFSVLLGPPCVRVLSGPLDRLFLPALGRPARHSVRTRAEVRPWDRLVYLRQGIVLGIQPGIADRDVKKSIWPSLVARIYAPNRPNSNRSSERTGMI